MNEVHSELIPMDLASAEMARATELRLALQAKGLIARTDSDLFWDFVFHAEAARVNTIPEIVLMMQKARYLHEYCNFQLGYEIATNSLPKTHFLARTDWLALLRKCVLLTTKLKHYPSIWPWESNIDIETWKQENDLTDHLLRRKKSNFYNT